MNKLLVTSLCVLAIGSVRAEDKKETAKPAAVASVKSVASTVQDTVYISLTSVQQTDLGKELTDKFTKRAAELNTKLMDKRQEAAKIENDLKARASLLTADAREKEEEKLRRLAREFEEMRDEAGREIEKLQQQASLELNKAATLAAEKLAKDHGFKVVKQKEEALFVDAALDYTAEFTKIMNTQYAQTQKTATKKTAAA